MRVHRDQVIMMPDPEFGYCRQRGTCSQSLSKYSPIMFKLISLYNGSLGRFNSPKLGDVTRIPIFMKVLQLGSAIV